MPRRLLVIEDDAGSRYAAERVLSAAGYEVYLAPTGAIALDLMRHHQFDGVLLDVVLPDTTGHAVLGELRQLQPTIPVIVISGYQAEALKAVAQGAESYLIKPYEPSALINEIRRWIGQP